MRDFNLDYELIHFFSGFRFVAEKQLSPC